VSFDPKTSISMVGREAFASEETLDIAADLASADVMVLNQEACVASRFIYVEGGHAWLTASVKGCTSASLSAPLHPAIPVRSTWNCASRSRR